MSGRRKLSTGRNPILLPALSPQAYHAHAFKDRFRSMQQAMARKLDGPSPPTQVQTENDDDETVAVLVTGTSAVDVS